MKLFEAKREVCERLHFSQLTNKLWNIAHFWDASHKLWWRREVWTLLLCWLTSVDIKALKLSRHSCFGCMVTKNHINCTLGTIHKWCHHLVNTNEQYNVIRRWKYTARHHDMYTANTRSQLHYEGGTEGEGGANWMWPFRLAGKGEVGGEVEGP